MIVTCCHKDLLLNKDFVDLVESAKKLGSLSDLERGIVQGTRQGNNQADQDTQRVDRSRVSGKNKGQHGMEAGERKICFHDVCTPLEENDRNKEANR